MESSQENIRNFSESSPKEKAEEMAKILWEKQAIDEELYLVADTTVITDYYLICTGRSSTHVKALADELVYEMTRRGVNPARTEGRDGAAWILVDYSSVIVHIFDRESRDYYRLERLLDMSKKIELNFEETK